MNYSELKVLIDQEYADLTFDDIKRRRIGANSKHTMRDLFFSKVLHKILLRHGQNSPNIIFGWDNFMYDTFTSSGTEITSAIGSGSDTHFCIAKPGLKIATGSEYEFQVEEGEVIVVAYQHTQNSGEYPYFHLFNSGNKSNLGYVQEGSNHILLTATASTRVSLMLTADNVATNFTTSKINVYRFKGNLIKSAIQNIIRLFNKSVKSLIQIEYD